MHDARRFFSFLLGASLALATARAADISNGSFVVRDGKTLEVTHGGRSLISGDEINYLPDFGQATTHGERIGDTSVLNVIQNTGDTAQFRKEVALHADGRLELTVKMRLFPHKNTEDKRTIIYSFRVPMSLLGGSTFTARVDRSYRTKMVTGTLSADRKDGSLTAKKCRFIAFEKDGLQLVFDCNPYGVMSLQDYCMYGDPVGSWNVVKEGDSVVFSFGQTARQYGGIFTSKIIIYQGPFDYEKKHPYSTWSYNGPTPAQAQFTFGTSADTKGFEKADLRAYTPEQGWGWSDPTGLQVVGTESACVLDNCVAGSAGKAAAFELDVVPGVYVLALRLGHSRQPLAPFDISVNGEQRTRTDTLQTGQTQEILIAHRVREPGRKLSIGFSGAWSLRSLVIQPVIYANQDFALDRSLWVATGRFEPELKLSWWDQPQPETGAPAPPLQAFTVARSSRPVLRGKDTPAAERLLPTQSRSEVLLPPDSDALAWRYDMKMGDLTGGCGCLMYELYTPELIERRVTELATAGVNTITISGLHMHHCFLDRWPIVTEYVRKVTEIAHRHGVKVIFHHDIPVVLYNGTGLQHMLSHLDWLARDIDHGRPTLRSYCIMNPDFRAAYFGRITQLARDTGIDGGMLDEGCFPGKDFCGCEHCRRAFTAQTGLVLPRDNTSPVFQNRDHPVWIAWLNWRKRAVGDFWIALRKAINSVNPDFCNMKYTTHGGFSSNWAGREFGSDLIQAGRGCDFLGTEIMARNVYDSRRAVYAFRRMKSALGDLYGLPIWGLVYHLDDPTFAYFGWAMNHMNRQTSWMSMIEGENMGRFLDWPGRMQCRTATSVADVAILFSAQSRDFTRMFSPSADVLGVSQCLADAHIQHDFILDEDALDKGRLHQYKLLILASTGCLSQRQAQTIRAYVREGGALLATTNAGLLNEQGFMQENFQLADVMGVDYVKASAIRGPHTVRFRSDDSTLVYPQATLRVKHREGADVLADILSKKGAPVRPVLIRNRYGKGQCVYLPIAFGAVNYEVEWRTGRKMTFEKNRELADLLVRLVRETASAPFDIQPVAIPEDVMMSVCREDADGQSQLLIHLLNATGTGIAKGEAMPGRKDWAKHGPAFPPLSADLVIDVRAVGAISGRITSPDYSGARPVGIVPGKDGLVRVTVKAADVSAYALVRIDLPK
ncbi:MAG: beta-galactosidase trimerization domain-containing protein [Lentisphaeria bacterium]|nr:beta-galactosidase trimerization domain-containing protein [Lentisphaeria bacterium]